MLHGSAACAHAAASSGGPPSAAQCCPVHCTAPAAAGPPAPCCMLAGPFLSSVAVLPQSKCRRCVALYSQLQRQRADRLSPAGGLLAVEGACIYPPWSNLILGLVGRSCEGRIGSVCSHSTFFDVFFAREHLEFNAPYALTLTATLQQLHPCSCTQDSADMLSGWHCWLGACARRRTAAGRVAVVAAQRRGRSRLTGWQVPGSSRRLHVTCHPAAFWFHLVAA